MDAYVGQTRSRKLIARLIDLGIGECTQRSEFPPRRHPWFQDNSAFSDWTAGLDFDDVAFLLALICAVSASVSPVFIVCPDRVASGLDSLVFGLRWRALCEFVLRARRCAGFRDRSLCWYLAVQDGMTEDDVRAVMHGFEGIFVGGTLPWKIQTAPDWVRLAHELGKPCHIGRVGTEDRVKWARRIGADSIDSCLPLWGEDNLQRFLRGLDASPSQGAMPW